MRKKDTLDPDIYYPVFKAHDTRFDGQVFIGVSSTGIYCRPVCRVKLPKKENCSFYPSAAIAEAQGYRPCLKCRPELAPGVSSANSVEKIAAKAVALMEEQCFYEGNLQQIAQDLQITDRHLRRVFVSEYGVTPSQYLQTSRLLMAKRLLTDTELSVTDVAFASGFGSIRRFNGLFLKTYRLSPTLFRKQAMSDDIKNDETMTLFLDYRPPYLWKLLLVFLNQRAIPGIEVIRDDIYYRTVLLKKEGKKVRGWIAARNMERKNRISVTLSAGLLPVLSMVLKRIKILFDTACEPEEIYDKLSVMNRIQEGICLPGVRLPGSFDPFEMSVRAVLGQQITIKAARTLAARVVQHLGGEFKTPIDGLTHTFPEPEDFLTIGILLEEKLGSLGIIRSRTRSIQALAKFFLENDPTRIHGEDLSEWMKQLEMLPGLGPWTVQYIAMRAFGYPDVFPHTDYGVKKVLQDYSPQEILGIAEEWRPWRSYAAITLWNSLLKEKREVL